MLDALSAGAATGVVLTGMAFGGTVLVTTPGLAAMAGAAFIFVLAICGATIPWFVGVFVFGPPVWMLGYKLGWRQAWVFTLVGAATPFTVLTGLLTLAFIAVPSSAPAPSDAVLSTLGFVAFVSAIGSVVGFVAHRVAYRS